MGDAFPVDIFKGVGYVRISYCSMRPLLPPPRVRGEKGQHCIFSRHPSCSMRPPLERNSSSVFGPEAQILM